MAAQADGRRRGACARAHTAAGGRRGTEEGGRAATRRTHRRAERHLGAGGRPCVRGRPRAGHRPARAQGFSPVGTHVLELRSASGTVKRSVTVRAGTRTVAEESIGPGYVSILSRIPLDILAGGRRIGTTEDDKILLPPGEHTLTLVNTRFGFRGEVTIEVKPGEVTPYTASLPTGRVVVNTTAGAEVLIEGQSVGIAPLGEQEIPVGSRDILVRHAELGEKRETVNVKRDQTSTVTLAFGTAGTIAPTRPPPPIPRLAPLSAPPAPRPRE